MSVPAETASPAVRADGRAIEIDRAGKADLLVDSPIPAGRQAVAVYDGRRLLGISPLPTASGGRAADGIQLGVIGRGTKPRRGDQGGEVAVMTSALLDVAPKLEKLIPLLGSDKDGEVVAAAAAITRTLKQAGADCHDVAAAVARTEPPGPVEPSG